MSCKSLARHALTADIGDEMITIERQIFAVHKKLLQKKYTNAFDRQINSVAGRNGGIFLEGENPVAFALFKHWLYTGVVPRLHFPQPAPPKDHPDYVENTFNHFLGLTDLYVFAEKQAMLHVMNATMDALQDSLFESGKFLNPCQIRAIFEKTEPESKLRDFCVAVDAIGLGDNCGQLQEKVSILSMFAPGYLNHLLQWLACNFHVISRRTLTTQASGGRLERPWWMLNRDNLCPCFFHVHGLNEAHKGHEKCCPEPAPCMGH